jgi:hypothetical protein
MTNDPLQRLLDHLRGRLKLSGGWLAVHILAAAIIAISVGWAILTAVGWI